jgi:prevent-host-death family protein
MRTVSHREMRNSSGEILRAVAAGETIYITNNGRLAAVIGPPSQLDLLVADGQARPPRKSLATLPAPKPRRPGSPTTVEIIADVRGRW